MEHVITSDVVVAYSQCPRKAHLLMFSPDKGEPHEYVQILEEKAHTNRIAHFKKLRHENQRMCGYDAERLANSNTVMVEATLNVPGLEAYCDVLTPVQTGASRGNPSYVSTLLTGTHTVTGDQKIALGFVGDVLTQIQQMSSTVGIIVNARGQKHTVKLDTMARKLRTILPTLQQ